MTSIPKSIKSGLATLRSALGSTITIYTRSNTTLNDEGDETVTWDSGTSVIGVVVKKSEERYFTPQGEPIRSVFNVYLKEDVSVDIGDRIVINSENYQVIEKNIPLAGDKDLAVLVTVTREDSD